MYEFDDDAPPCIAPPSEPEAPPPEDKSSTDQSIRLNLFIFLFFFLIFIYFIYYLPYAVGKNPSNEFASTDDVAPESNVKSDIMNFLSFPQKQEKIN
jgi:hypothetical protein